MALEQSITVVRRDMRFLPEPMRAGEPPATSRLAGKVPACQETCSIIFRDRRRVTFISPIHRYSVFCFQYAALVLLECLIRLVDDPESPRLRRTPLLGLLSAVVLLSCGRGSAPAPHDAGAADLSTERPDPGAALCARYQATDAAAPSSFDVVQQIFEDNCTACHSGGAPMDLSRGVAFSNIVNHAVPPIESCGGVLVVPGDPASSYLYQKLTNSHPCAGAQMPLDEFFTSAPLPACVTEIIRAWIEGGAMPTASDAGH
jgi:hypothetical protein